MSPRFSFPPMKEFNLPNGLTVVLIPEHEQEGLVIALQMPFGRFADQPGREGCAELCIGLMQKGTVSRTFEAFSDEFEQHGASIFAEVGEEHAMLGVKMLTRFRERLFPLFWEMVTAPRFDKKEFDRIQKEVVTGLRAESIDPGTIANRHFYQVLAGSNHPAGRFNTVESIRKLRLEHITAFYHENVAPGGCTLVIAGDFDEPWFESWCRQMVTAWEKTVDRKICEAPPVDNADNVVRLVEKNDLTQVSLLVGQAAPGELDTDRNRIAIANYIFGAGNFSSRLMTRIRSSAGNTYGIVSHIAAERRFGALTITTSTQNRQLQEVLAAILNEYRLFCNNGITEDELEKAKRFVIGNMAFQLEGISNIVEKTLWLRFYQRDSSYIEAFDKLIGNITRESVNRAISDSFDPDKLVIIAVGKKAEIISQLESFGNVRHYHYKERLR